MCVEKGRCVVQMRSYPIIRSVRVERLGCQAVRLASAGLNI